MGANSRSVTYGVDVVFCIDATESMFPFLGVVKENALHFYQDFMRIMEQKEPAWRTKNILRLYPEDFAE